MRRLYIEMRRRGFEVSFCDRFRPSVDRPSSDAYVFCPRWNQTPTHRFEVANLFAVFLADSHELIVADSDARQLDLPDSGERLSMSQNLRATKPRPSDFFQTATGLFCSLLP